MNTSLIHIIKKWIPEKSKVIDFGCGDGSLLKDLIDETDDSAAASDENDTDNLAEDISLDISKDKSDDETV